jgi:N-acetylmuramic acid 6-phosphate (MurNAc-6-P) etherase
MLADIDGEKDVNINTRNPEISIRGSGTGPFVVLARNFAPGTNAADIEAALEPVAGHIVGVHITSHKPYVNAQIACAEKWGADAIVAQFNGQKVRQPISQFS